jgi:3',5'-cyclic-AMP phosphodiesterase
MPVPFLLAQLSDFHIGATWGNGDPTAGLKAAVDAVLALPDRPDAVVATGDLTDNAAADEYRVVADQLSRIGAPVYVLPGNHDDRDALREAFGLPGASGAPVQYAVDLGPLRLVVMDSTRPGEARGELDAARLDWLEAELAAAPAVPTLVAMHHPPLVTGSDAWDAIGVPAADRRALGEVLARHRHVRGVVAGHVHRTIAAVLGGCAVLSIPSTYVQGRLDFTSDDLSLEGGPAAFAVHAVIDGDVVSHLQPVDAL